MRGIWGILHYLNSDTYDIVLICLVMGFRNLYPKLKFKRIYKIYDADIGDALSEL